MDSPNKSRDEKEDGKVVIESEAVKVGSSLISKNFLFRLEFENVSLN